MADIKEKVASPEGAPRLKALKVEAQTIGEAMGKVEKGGGQADLDWVLNPANFAKASKMLKGGSYFFFPNAAGAGGKVPCVGEGGGGFWRDSFHRGSGWGSVDRVVVRD